MKTILTLMTVMLMFVATACGSDTGVETGDEAAGDDIAEEGSAAEDEDMSEAEAETDEEMADDEMADDEMADDEMADDEMADDEMADDEMADDEMADDEMAEGEDAEMDNAGDGMALLGDGAAELSEGLLYVDDEVGEGEAAAAGDEVAVHYTGTFENGEKFDSSLDRGTPFVFTLGQGQVIRGWDMGVEGMMPGGKRRLWIPSDLAYGDAGHPAGIPGGTNLLFDVELVEVR